MSVGLGPRHALPAAPERSPYWKPGAAIGEAHWPSSFSPGPGLQSLLPPGLLALTNSQLPALQGSHRRWGPCWPLPVLMLKSGGSLFEPKADEALDPHEALDPLLLLINFTSCLKLGLD
ncbi:hypothetical protein NDU88_006167 [Pleurodeles waltl]|uniref:Uncharacterized protein n=1 Tax=Pleurodeles waltl TaxID=8319 RepID=A0AAV7WD61_PLEWA|nr:hypothetical protein NDU88_006167 [Pleurodeles waltl]